MEGEGENDGSTSTSTYCISLSSILPGGEVYSEKVIPFLRNATQTLGDLVHRSTLLTNFHFTRLCQLPEGYPLEHAPLVSPFDITIWAQKLLLDPTWHNDDKGQVLLDSLTQYPQQGAIEQPVLHHNLTKRDLAARPNIKFGLVKEPYTSQVCSLCPETHRINAAYIPTAGPLAQPSVTYIYDPGRDSKLKDRVAQAIAQGVAVPNGGECYVVRACQGQHHGHTVLFIGRDINAARNIMIIILAHMNGLPRPPQYTKAYWQHDALLKPLDPTSLMVRRLSRSREGKPKSFSL